MKRVFLLLFTVLSNIAFSQVGYISTFIGQNVANDTGDGGPISRAAISQSAISNFDTNGTVYLCSNRNLVRKILANDTIYHYSGNRSIAVSSGDGGLVDTANFNEVSTLHIDKFHNCAYITENRGGLIRKVDLSTSIITTVAGSRTGVSDSGVGCMATSAKLGRPIMTQTDREGNIYVYTCCHIRKVNSTTGMISNFARCDSIGSTFRGEGRLATDAVFSVGQIYLDLVGNLFIADDHSRILRVDHETNIITTYAGGLETGSPYAFNVRWDSAFLPDPRGITGDEYGNIYVTSPTAYMVWKITPERRVFTVAGSGVRGFSDGRGDTAKLGSLETISINDCGDLFVQDNDNARIRKISFNNRFSVSIYNADTSSDLHSVVLCYPMPYTFKTFVPIKGRGAIYRWYVNGVLMGGNTPDFTYTPHNGDSVYCTYTSHSYCTPDTFATSTVIHMVVLNLSPPVVTISSIAGAAIGDTVHLTATITGAGSSYILKWYNSDSLFATTTTPTVQYVKTRAIDSITAVLTSTARGCYDSTGSPVKTIVRYNTSVPVVTTANEIWLQPNPAQTEIQIVAGNDWAQLVITDVSGRVMYRESNQQHRSTQLNIASWPKGLYFVHIGTVAGKFLKD